MHRSQNTHLTGTSRQAEEQHLEGTLKVIHENINNYGRDVSRMRDEIDDMLEHFHDDNPELINTLENTITMYENMNRALERNEKARKKPYFGRIIFQDETFHKHVAKICHELDIPTPAILKSHINNYVDFNNTTFLPRDFIESIDFDKFILENATLSK